MIGKIRHSGCTSHCCEDGRLLGSNVPLVNIYINAATTKVCVSVPLNPYDLGMYSHTYIPPSNIFGTVLHSLPRLCGNM